MEIEKSQKISKTRIRKYIIANLRPQMMNVCHRAPFCIVRLAVKIGKLNFVGNTNKNELLVFFFETVQVLSKRFFSSPLILRKLEKNFTISGILFSFYDFDNSFTYSYHYNNYTTFVVNCWISAAQNHEFSFPF